MVRCAHKFFVYSITALIVSGAGTLSCFADGMEDEVTIAQPLDLSHWINSDFEFDEELIGSWQFDNNTTLSIGALPVASNTCLVKIENRFVPGFLIEHGSEQYIVVGEYADADLQLVPSILKFTLSTEGDRITVSEISFENPPSTVDSPQALYKLLDSQVSIGTAKEGTKLQRI